MTFQIVNEYFKARIQLLEERGRVTTLATPLLLTANNEVSRLFLGEERPLVRNVTGQTLITDSAVATTPNTTIEFRPVGTTLLITPNINSDRTVTLRLLQEDSSINSGGATIPIVVSSTGGVQNVSVDVVATKSISGTFVAKDGMAVAIGGLIQEQVSDVRSQVPILGRIPLLGFLFRSETKAKTRNEMVIMIRPHVISTPSEGEEISRKLLKGLSVHPSMPDAKGDMGTFREPKGKVDQSPAQ
jgi:general secretion pathway protein D